MRASDWEFRYRFWIFGALFWLAFAAYFIDGVPSGVRLSRWLAHDVLGGADWLHVYRGIMAVAALFVVATAGLRTWATAYLRSDVVHDKVLHSEGLVADGPYRHLRNPLYLGNYLLVLGFGFVACVPGFLWLLVSIPLFSQRLIQREEHELAQSQGERYRAYRSRVPRLWPALWPRLPAAGLQPRYGQAIRGELWVWSFAAAAVTYAVTLDRTRYGLVMAAGMVLYLGMNWLGRPGKTPSVPSAR
ncbi:MAG: isoprenylcysteine carboxylmethyltransferase family protein [Myxococcales bacterium]|nr:isoprenylcysteine carboxylmethyltransferase family protein [Myxococcales bacterium]